MRKYFQLLSKPMSTIKLIFHQEPGGDLDHAIVDKREIML